MHLAFNFGWKLRSPPPRDPNKEKVIYFKFWIGFYLCMSYGPRNKFLENETKFRAFPTYTFVVVCDCAISKCYCTGM